MALARGSCVQCTHAPASTGSCLAGSLGLRAPRVRLRALPHIPQCLPGRSPLSGVLEPAQWRGREHRLPSAALRANASHAVRATDIERLDTLQ